MTLFFDNAYEGTPSWDVGRPHAVVARLGRAFFAGRILDLGCGTGEDAWYLAGLGCEVVGVDFAVAAIERAQRKRPAGADPAAQVDPPRFVVADALALATVRPPLGDPFDGALDVGLFHTLQPADRVRYAASVREVLRPGARFLLVCWSDRNAFGRGPERISRGEIRSAFAAGWSIEGIDPAPLETRLEEGSVHAWAARLRRLP